jgi:hypothetical protein
MDLQNVVLRVSSFFYSIFSPFILIVPPLINVRENKNEQKKSKNTGNIVHTIHSTKTNKTI